MVSKKICFYVSKIKNNVNYKWLRERERESTCTISMLSLNLWCMLSVKILINVIDTNDAKLQSMSSFFPYRNMILPCHKPRHFYLRFIFFPHTHHPSQWDSLNVNYAILFNQTISYFILPSFRFISAIILLNFSVRNVE